MFDREGFIDYVGAKAEIAMEYRSADGVTVRIRFEDLFDVQEDIEQLCADFY